MIAQFLRDVLGLTEAVAGVSRFGSWLQAAAGCKRMAAAVTNVTTTFANLTDLTVTLIAGRKYSGYLIVTVNEALAADGFKLDLDGGTATMTSINFGFSTAIGATLGTRTSTALATPITLTALADTNDVIFEIPISLVCNAAGTLIPRQAKNGDAAGGTMTVRINGFLLLNDMP